MKKIMTKKYRNENSKNKIKKNNENNKNIDNNIIENDKKEGIITQIDFAIFIINDFLIGNPDSKKCAYDILQKIIQESDIYKKELELNRHSFSKINDIIKFYEFNEPQKKYFTIMVKTFIQLNNTDCFLDEPHKALIHLNELKYFIMNPKNHMFIDLFIDIRNEL